jgi:hypothetical protein
MERVKYFEAEHCIVYSDIVPDCQQYKCGMKKAEI